MSSRNRAWEGWAFLTARSGSAQLSKPPLLLSRENDRPTTFSARLQACGVFVALLALTQRGTAGTWARRRKLTDDGIMEISSSAVQGEKEEEDHLGDGDCPEKLRRAWIGCSYL